MQRPISTYISNLLFPMSDIPALALVLILFQSQIMYIGHRIYIVLLLNRSGSCNDAQRKQLAGKFQSITCICKLVCNTYIYTMLLTNELKEDIDSLDYIIQNGSHVWGGYNIHRAGNSSLTLTKFFWPF